MSHQEDIRLMAHLMRRAGFGATREELKERRLKGLRNRGRGASASGAAAGH